MGQSYGYGAVSADGFVGAERFLKADAWASVEARTPNEQGFVKGIRTAPMEVVCKTRLQSAIAMLIRTLASQDGATDADAAWDRHQQRLDAEIALKETDDDDAVVAAARRLRARLLSGNGTDQTTLAHGDEVNFGRKQVAVAAHEAVADDVKRCGVGPTLKRIATATEALALAIGHDGAGVRKGARAAQVRQAMAGCVSAFNGVHDDLDAAVALTAPGPERMALEALREPLQRLLDEHADRSAPSAPSAEAPKPLPAKPAEPTP